MTDKTDLPELVGALANLPEHTQATIRAYGSACARTALQSPEVQRLRAIEKAGQSVLDYTHIKHRPPVREALPCGEMTWVRVHALADLHDAIHPHSPAKTAAMKEQL